MTGEGIFHAGELAVQERVGERAIARRRETMIGDRLPDGARAFLTQQGVAAVSSEESDGSLWASMWCGTPGFISSREDGTSVEIHSALHHTHASDPVRRAIRANEPLGMLVIDFATRRRMRINGRVRRADASGIEVGVQEVFGNCPKYIQRRQRVDDGVGGAPEPVESGRALDAHRRRLIAQADTMFVGSIHPARGLDVSHRGGNPGFVQVQDDRTLRIPDYPGNSMFQTLGNFDVDARAGLTFIDFERNRALSLTGLARSDFGLEDPRAPTNGTGRYWSFIIERWLEFPLPAMMQWTLIERSPLNPRRP
ncbi:MAG: pyridoxamine 5'-phosphate oxidase family protein [bacterium]